MHIIHLCRHSIPHYIPHLIMVWYDTKQKSFGSQNKVALVHFLHRNSTIFCCPAYQPSKKEHCHGGAVCRDQRHGQCEWANILAVASLRWVGRGRCQRVLFIFVNWLRKKLISELIHFSLVFYFAPTWLPQNWLNRTPLTSPPGHASCSIPPLSLSCLYVFVWLLC